MSFIQSFSAGALRTPRFDAFFVMGIPLAALCIGALVTLRPELFLLIFTVDLWLLGYHHVAATFTRVCFDSESFRAHRNLVLFLPIVVAIFVVAGVAAFGLWPLATVYLYWQWWHYTRQSEGIQKAYAAKNKNFELGDRRLGRIVHYAVPIAGILTVSGRQPETFVFLPIQTLPVPMLVVQIAQALALLATSLWLVEQIRIWRRGQLAATYTLYMCSHLVIYAVAYIGFEDATRGWLVINMWHNTQYLAFVWMFNNRRFTAGVHVQHVVLSTLSQTKNWWLYVAACLAISTGFYYSAEMILGLLGVSSIAYLAAFYQAINFHHYIVDSKVWKLRRPAIRETIGIT